MYFALRVVSHLKLVKNLQISRFIDKSVNNILIIHYGDECSWNMMMAIFLIRKSCHSHELLLLYKCFSVSITLFTIFKTPFFSILTGISFNLFCCITDMVCWLISHSYWKSFVRSFCLLFFFSFFRLGSFVGEQFRDEML